MSDFFATLKPNTSIPSSNASILNNAIADIIDSKPSATSPSCEHFDSTNENETNTTNTSNTTSALTPELHKFYGSNETMRCIASRHFVHWRERFK